MQFNSSILHPESPGIECFVERNLEFRPHCAFVHFLARRKDGRTDGRKGGWETADSVTGKGQKKERGANAKCQETLSALAGLTRCEKVYISMKF